ncbi:MAG: hypothetical protein WD000_02885 [Thermodesulfobacteriota bacterium]
MYKKLNKILSITLALALSINFLLYSSQSYSPPRAESISYSIVNCPSHENQHHTTNIVQIITGTESKNGSEKDCFCYDCCNQRVSFDITLQTVLLVLEKYQIRIETINESIHVEDSYKNLPIRSPPNILA